MKKSVARALSSYSNCWSLQECTRNERRYEKKRSHKTFRRIEKREVERYD